VETPESDDQVPGSKLRKAEASLAGNTRKR
jgi:hypothetical protein